jgi:hypothetical protein
MVSFTLWPTDLRRKGSLSRRVVVPRAGADVVSKKRIQVISVAATLWFIIFHREGKKLSFWATFSVNNPRTIFIEI